MYLYATPKFLIHQKARAKFSTNFDKQRYSSSWSIEVCLKMLSGSRKYFGNANYHKVLLTSN